MSIEFAKIENNIQRMVQVWNELTYVEWSHKSLEILHLIVCNLIDNGKHSAFRKISDLAVDIETQINSVIGNNYSASQKQRKTIERMLMQCQTLVQKSPELNPESTQVLLPDVVLNDPQAPDQNRLIFVVDDDPILGEYLALQLAIHDWKVEAFQNLAEFYTRLDQHKPVALLLDISMKEGELAGIDAITKIRSISGEETPIFLVSSRTDIGTRLQAVRAGANAYFSKPLNIDAINNRLVELSKPRVKATGQVLLVSDDGNNSSHYRELLESEGCKVVIEKKPDNTLELLAHYPTDLVILDLNQAAITGEEMVQVIRQDEGFASLPIVFLSEELNKDGHDKLIGLGIDEIFIKPVLDDRFITVVKERIQSNERINRRLKQISSFDPLTGTSNPRFFMEELDIYLSQIVDDEHNHRTLIYLAVDQFEEMTSNLTITAVHTFIARVSDGIRSTLATEDLVSYFDNGVYTVLTRSMPTQQSTALVESIIQSLRKQNILLRGTEFHISCSVGILKLNKALGSARKAFSLVEEAASIAMDKGGNSIQLVSKDEQENTKRPSMASKEWQKAVENALRQKDFDLVYQPVVRLHGKHEEIYQVLVRMVDASRHLVLPRHFLPHIAKWGSMTEVDRWVVEHAIDVLSNDSRTRGRSVFFIKLSIHSVLNSMTLPWLSNCLKNSSLKGEGRVVIEISAKEIGDHVTRVATFMRNLKELHCSVALNHFGLTPDTAILAKELPLDYVKIQGRFGKQFINNEKVHKSLKNLLAASSAFGFQTIIGGIEDPNALTLFSNWNVQYFQGFWLREPDTDLNYDFNKDMFEKPKTA